MPRNVRNFFLEIYVDGRKTDIATGPRGKDGGFLVKVFQRVDGEVKKVGYLIGTEDHGELELSIETDALKQILYRSRR